MTGDTRVHVITLGGTISMTGDAETGVRPTLSADDLLGSVGQAPDLQVTTETFLTVPGSYLTIDDILAVHARAKDELDAGAQGIVVVQGTDTLEETAFVADLVHDRAEAIVFTGAMRHPKSLGADGPANLRDAIVAAAGLQDTGVLVCMGTELHAARYVAKTHAFSPAAFASPSVGPIGWVIENQARLLARPSRPEPMAPGRLDDTYHAEVPLYRVSLGDNGRGLEALAATGPDGIVIEGFGVGHLNRETADIASRLAETIPVVLASRTGGGTTLASTYGFEGSERDLLDRGLIGAGALNGLKARLLLSLSLRAGDGATACRRRFADWAR